MKALVLLGLSLYAAVVVAGSELPELRHPRVEVSFALPDGSTQSTVLVDDEVRLLIGGDGEYQVAWWVRAAEKTLDIPKLLAAIPGGTNAKSAVSITHAAPDRDAVSPSSTRPGRDIPLIGIGYERLPQQ